MKNTYSKPYILLIITFILAVIAWGIFANNVWAIVAWWQHFLQVGGNSAELPTHIGGLCPQLDWTVVDYSAVTTFIPALGITCLVVALWKIIRGKRCSAEDFPFFAGSDQLHIALGLFGTLWGIIVIGYFKLETVTMAHLMQCLHTALFSTLMAVVWVFLIDRPFVRPYFVRLLQRAGLEEVSSESLADTVERLVVRLGEASEAFDKREKAFEEAFEKRLANYERAFDIRQHEYEELFRRRLAELAQVAEESKARANRLQKRLDAVTSALKEEA